LLSEDEEVIYGGENLELGEDLLFEARVLRDIFLNPKSGKSNAVFEHFIPGFDYRRIVKDRSILGIVVERLGLRDVEKVYHKLKKDEDLLIEIDGRNILHIAFMRGDVAIVDFLLNSKLKENLLDQCLLPMSREMIDLYANKNRYSSEEFAKLLANQIEEIGEIEHKEDPLELLLLNGNGAKHRNLFKYLWERHQDIFYNADKSRKRFLCNDQMYAVSRELCDGSFFKSPDALVVSASATGFVDVDLGNFK
jgi:hypothetical protein